MNMPDYLSSHLSMAEFIQTSHRGIDNTLPSELLSAAMNTAQMLERIRSSLGNKAVLVSSGYRCLKLNRAVGSGDSSDHLKAMALDFIVPSFGTPYEVAKHIAQHIEELQVGQLIHEFGRWVHVSTRTPGKLINRIITYSSSGTAVGINRV